MADRSSIEWTDATWNPVTGCTEVSPGCDHCYAKTFAERWRGTPGHPFERGFDLTLRPERLSQPLRWPRARRIFVNSMGDLFHDGVPDNFIAAVWAVMAATPRHTYQVLTKRHARMRSLLSRGMLGTEGFPDMVEEAMAEFTHAALDHWPLPNVWVGVSVEDQQWADIRIPALLDTPAAVRWLSCEPLLGRVDLTTRLKQVQIPACDRCDPGGPLDLESGHLWGRCSCVCHPVEPQINWVVAGGESGPGARPMHPDWARSLRDQCTLAGVPFLFKQWGAWRPPADGDEGGAQMVHVGKKAAGRVLDGRTWDEYPQAWAGPSREEHRRGRAPTRSRRA